MARGLNLVQLIGNLGQDPETKYAASGTAISNFSIAVSENRKEANGEWNEHTEWVRIKLFGMRAETAKDYLRKGSRVYIEGKMQTRSWEDKDGTKKFMTEIIGNNLLMLGGKPDSGGQGNSRPPTQNNNRTQDKGTPPPPPDNWPPDDDMPF